MVDLSPIYTPQTLCWPRSCQMSCAVQARIDNWAHLTLVLFTPYMRHALILSILKHFEASMP